MKRVGKGVFFVVLILTVVFTALSFTGFRTQYADRTMTWIKGAGDIRWGIDIRGGVDATFTPVGDYQATPEEMASAQQIISTRMISQNITDYEMSVDAGKSRIIVRFPWRSDETDYDPARALEELGGTALLTFRDGVSVDATGNPTGDIVLEGRDVLNAEAMVVQQTNEPVVQLELTAEGAIKFAEATERLVGKQISIWMDDLMISAPIVNEKIPDGKASINGMRPDPQTGKSAREVAKELADRINAGALPFEMTTDNYSTISPTLGTGAKDAMVLAGVITFVLIAILMVARYRVPGAIAVVALAGQVGLMVALITGFFGGFPSFTLTLPGIAGIILSVGMGVDANVITAERIREEIAAGKTIDGAIEAGFKRAFTAIFDGNITVIIVAVILMGAFGPPDSIFAKLLTPFFFLFGPAPAGNIYSFGYTLLTGVLCNFIMGVAASHVMLRSLSKYDALRKPWLYGGDKI